MQSMSNALFNIFYIHKTVAELWSALQCRHVNEDGNKSYLINKYIEYQMEDCKPTIDQVNELCDIATECDDSEKLISETFQVSAIVGKIPPSWNDYQTKLKHNQAILPGFRRLGAV